MDKLAFLGTNKCSETNEITPWIICLGGSLTLLLLILPQIKKSITKKELYLIPMLWTLALLAGIGVFIASALFMTACV